MNKLRYIFFGLFALITLAACDSVDTDVEVEIFDSSTWPTKNKEYYKKIVAKAEENIKVAETAWKAHQPDSISDWYEIMSYARNNTNYYDSYIIVQVLEQDQTVHKGRHAELIKSRVDSLYYRNDVMESPLFTDSCNVTYRGNLIPFEDGSTYAKYYDINIAPDNMLVGFTFETKYFGANMYTIADLKKEAIFTNLAPSGSIEGMATALLYMHPGDRWRVYIPYALGYGETSSSDNIPGSSVLIFDLYMKSFTTTQMK